MKKQFVYYSDTVLNSYSILFFSQNKVFGLILLLASFFNITAGITGLVCTLFTVLVMCKLGFNKEITHSGLYSFNALLLGIGFGTFFSFNYSFFLWLIAASLLVIIVSVNLTAFLGKYGLPILSIPFVFVFWLVLIASNGYSGMGLVQKDSYVVFELYIGNARVISEYVNQLPLPNYLALFFRSLSAVLFQNNILAGILIAIGLWIHSRIAFSLVTLGFFIACLINHLTGTYPDGISNYHLGANFMMISLGIGGFFLIPSIRSYFWAAITVLLSFLLVNGMTRFLSIYNLPILSMPFSLLTIGLLYFFMLRIQPGKLRLTPIQNYSPETNLYQYTATKERLKDFHYLPLNLPFMGIWTVSQDYNGQITHKGDWAQALDFVITDLDQQTFEYPGNKLEHYYCFNKPVLACADGFVQEIIQHIEDNRIGQVNLEQNWGNTVILKHAEGLYSKVSHLKQLSVKVKLGDFVKQGDLIALCGSSGRSPEPHLHFQLQTTSYIGSKTISYPFAYFQEHNELKSFTIPKTGDQVQPLETNAYLKQAFNFQPGYQLQLNADDGRIETWETLTNAYNQTYLYCRENHAVAYFVKNNYVFYFTSFYGNKRSLLYLFYKAAYRVHFSAHAVKDEYTIDSSLFKPQLWLQDLIAPFYLFVKSSYSNSYTLVDQGMEIQTDNATIMLTQHGLHSITVKQSKTKTNIKCTIKSI
ncbi:MAG: urea transporter [Pedobacter sp.]|nr:urea transporter [Pedobacter sp.]